MTDLPPATGVFNLKTPGPCSSMLAESGQIVGKTTTSVNLAQAFTIRLPDARVLLIDFDPQGNLTQASGIKLDAVQTSIADLIRDRSLPEENAIYQGASIDVIPATHKLAQVEREMIGMTNGELRLAQRIRNLRSHYSFIVIDAAPTFGTLLNSVLNSADQIIVPVDSGIFALHGIRSLLAEIEEIKAATNPNLKILGFLLTLADSTNISNDVLDTLVENFGEQVLSTRIRRSVKLKEAPAFGRTIFHHAPQSTGAEDYLKLADEILERLKSKLGIPESRRANPLNASSVGVSHE